MATSSKLLKKPDHGDYSNTTTTDLTVCGICLGLIDDPKALPCLHTYCCGCLEEWTKEHADELKVKCPVCKEEFPLPHEGVSGLRSNFYVNTLKEKAVLQSTLKMDRLCCTFCDESDNPAIAWCIDCKDNLCTNCVKCHKTLKPLKTHKVYSLEDIRSDKVDIKKAPMKRFCKKHEDQVPRFFCETCGVLICRDCTVVDHPVTKHTLVNVDEVSGEQRKMVKDLTDRCQKVASVVQEYFQAVVTVQEDLVGAVKKAHAEADHSAQQIKDEILANLEKRQHEVSEDIDTKGREANAKLNQEKDTLEKQRLQLSRALTFAKSVSENGSPYDLAAVYTSLMDTLTKLSDLKPVEVQEDLSKVMFVAAADFTINVPPFGRATHIKSSMRSRSYHDVSGEWELETTLSSGHFKYAVGMAIFPATGRLAVACKDRVEIFESIGGFKHNNNVQESSTVSKPRGVVITDDGSLIITDQSEFVKIFDPGFKLTNKFESYPPSNTTIIWNSSLSGLAMDSDEHLIVGEVKHKFISIHKRSGEHLDSFSVSVHPWFISVSPSNNVIVVSHPGQNDTKILNYKGQELHTLSTALPSPTGSCFNGDSELIIARQEGSDHQPGIHRFGTDGKYLGCITRDVKNPTGVLITKDGKLWVLEWKHVKVFKKK